MVNLRDRRGTLSGPHIPVPTFPLNTPRGYNRGSVILNKGYLECIKQKTHQFVYLAFSFLPTFYSNCNRMTFSLTGGNWQKWKRVFLTCPCHEIYRDKAVVLKSCKYTWKITIFVKMWNLGQYRENLIFCE